MMALCSMEVFMQSVFALVKSETFGILCFPKNVTEDAFT